MKKKNKKNKVFLIVALILCITIGYAALTTTLNITGNSEIKNAKWDIHFTNLVVDDTSVEASTPATIDANKTTVNYAVNLVKPGDSYSFAVDVVNEGTIDAMIKTVTNTGLTEEQQKYVEYSITYDNGSELKVKDSLQAGAKKNIKVKVKYKDDINPEDLPQEDKTLNLTFTVEYVQADDTVTPPPVQKMKQNGISSVSSYQSKVTKLVTKTNINVPATAKEQWDISEAGDGSVVMYVEDDGTGNGTYQVTIGGDGGKVGANGSLGYSLAGFAALKEADLSNFDTSNVTNMGGMFTGCSSLTSVDLSSFDTSNVTEFSSMFYNCSSLTSLDLSNFDTSNVTYMSYMFYGCSSLTSLNLSNFNTSKVISMESMFKDCRSLKSLNLSGLSNSKTTNMGYMFQNCSSLTNLNLSNFNTSAVTNMSFMFEKCSSLSSLDLSSFNTSKVTEMAGMFEDCGSLTSLDLSGFNTSKVTEMFNMFQNCRSLTNLDLSSFDTSSLTYMGYMFENCSKLITSITIRNSNAALGNPFFNAATEAGAKITVNYTSETSDLVDQMIATKSDTSNVVKGSLVS